MFKAGSMASGVMASPSVKEVPEGVHLANATDALLEVLVFLTKTTTSPFTQGDTSTLELLEVQARPLLVSVL